ncbi:MAG: L-sorbose 1-phosphate reductase, partial [Clostridiaceae bacterium]|nr:L-sorbose 1-phosphate reductase [Clostridiaceae bacterium]
DPSAMVTHIGGLDSVVDTTLNLPKIPGGKKLVYTQISLPLTAINDFRTLGETDEIFRKLADLVEANNGLWCKAAEDYLLAHAKPI